MKPGIGFLAAAFVVSTVAAASADTVTVHLKKLDRRPIPGLTVHWYLASPRTLLDTVVTDASGVGTLTDNAFAGQLRCIEVEGPPIITYYESNVDVAPTYFQFAMDACFNVFHPDEYFWQFRHVADVSIFGGVGGYVNPNNGETATIVIKPYVADTMTVKFFSTRGKLIATRVKAVLPKIQNEIEWDARGDDGQIVASGIYIAHIIGAGISTTKKIAVIRK